MPGWFGATFLGRICLILGGLDPCPDGLGHFFRDEVPQSARLSAGGGGVQSLFGQCLNAFVSNFNGASLTNSAPVVSVMSVSWYTYVKLDKSYS